MDIVLVFAATLVVAVLVSELAHRSIISTAVLFLIAGFVAGPGILDAVDVQPEDGGVFLLAELALFAVLFTDGMRAGFRDLASAWRLPGRALLFGFPLTLVGTALLAHFVARLPWAESFLLGAALSPTDPVFASAIIGRKEIPWRLRHLLNVESGLNDGLALPVVVVLIAVVGRQEPESLSLLLEVVAGIGLGLVIPWVAIRLERLRQFSASTTYEPLNAFAIGLLVLATTSVLHANEFLAAFTAGVTVATIAPEVREAFHRFGELVAELLKLAALLLFGALLTPTFLADISPWGYLFALLALLVVRPAALGVSLIGSRLRLGERAAAAWFGPKGFASIVYGLLILASGGSLADELFHLVGLVAAASIIAHSSTDVVLARRFATADAEKGGRGPRPGRDA